MLILNRRVNESIVLNGIIRITILATEPNKVKIGIDAPPDVVIVREELLREDYMPQSPLRNRYPHASDLDPE